jgi:hypothetical protein
MPKDTATQVRYPSQGAYVGVEAMTDKEMTEILTSLVAETTETKFLNDMRASQVVDTQMFDNLRVYQGVLQCRIKVQEFDGHGYQVSQVMWEWRDVEVVT